MFRALFNSMIRFNTWNGVLNYAQKILLVNFEQKQKTKKNERLYERIFSMVYFDFLNNIFFHSIKKHDNILLGNSFNRPCTICTKKKQLMLMCEVRFCLFFWPTRWIESFLSHIKFVYFLLFERVNIMLLKCCSAAAFENSIPFYYYFVHFYFPNRIGVNSIRRNFVYTNTWNRKTNLTLNLRLWLFDNIYF